MPFRVRKIPVKGPKDFAIQKKVGPDSWTIVGRSTSRPKAEASKRAREQGSKHKKK